MTCLLVIINFFRISAFRKVTIGSMLYFSSSSTTASLYPIAGMDVISIPWCKSSDLLSLISDLNVLEGTLIFLHNSELLTGLLIIIVF